MKTRIALLVTVVAIIFSSCKKADTNDPIPTTNNKVKTYTEDVTIPGTDHQVVTFTPAYDGSDRIISLTGTNGGKFLFTYPDQYSFTMDISDDEDETTLHEVVYLNSNKLFDSTLQHVDEEDTLTEKYIYDAGGRLTQMKEYEYYPEGVVSLYNTTNYEYDSNGDLAKTTDTDGTINLYEYYTDASYYLPSTGLLQNIISTQKYHLIKKHTATIGDDTESADFTYTFDSNNRISTETAVTSNGATVIKTYTYY